MDTSAPFKWLDMLEQEFDRNFTCVDVLLEEADFEDSYAVDGGTLTQIRQRMSYITGAFGQLVHKTLTIFQNNLKLEAQVLAAEEDAARTEARCKTLADEVRSLTAQLAALSSHNGKKSDSILVEEVHPDPEVVKLLEEDAQRRMLSAFRAQLATSQYAHLKQANEALKQQALQAQSDGEALRLTLRYLDKERAGRIQQIQLLSNDKMSVDERNRVWAQLESEISLQRCKTVVQTCLARQQKTTADTSLPKLDHNLINSESEPFVGEIRTVKYPRPPENGALGLSIVGGREVALPIIISSVTPVSPLAGQVVVGDLIKMANGIDLSVASRQEAIDAIMSPLEKTQDEQFELVVCYLGGADDGIYDDELVASGSLNSSRNTKNNAAESPRSDEYETVWLQNGELWPAVPSGVSVLEENSSQQQYSSFQNNNRTTPPSFLQTVPEVVINEKVLQASLFSASALLSNAAFNASSRVSAGNGAVFTLKTGVQPRENEGVEDLAASLSHFSNDKKMTDLSGSNLGGDSECQNQQQVDFAASSTLSDIAFSADV